MLLLWIIFSREFMHCKLVSSYPFRAKTCLLPSVIKIVFLWTLPLGRHCTYQKRFRSHSIPEIESALGTCITWPSLPCWNWVWCTLAKSWSADPLAIDTNTRNLSIDSDLLPAPMKPGYMENLKSFTVLDTWAEILLIFLQRHDKNLNLFFSYLVTIRRKLISLRIKATQRKLKHRIVALTFLSLWQNTWHNVGEDGFILDHGFRSVSPHLVGCIEVTIFTKYLFWIVYICLCVSCMGTWVKVPYRD